MEALLEVPAELNTGTKSLVKILRINGYRLGLLTNTIPSHARWNRKNGLYQFFDDDLRIVSCEVGVRKPEEDIYRLAVKIAGIEPERIVFVDDNGSNVEVSRRVGIKGIIFEGVEKLVDELKGFEVNCYNKLI